MLHREEPLSIALVARGTYEELLDAIDAFVHSTRWCIHVLLYEERGRIGELREQYPEVTFIVFNTPLSFGAMANVMANECYTTYFFITRSDSRLVSFDENQAMHAFKRSSHPASITPLITNKYGDAIPSIQAPMLRDNHIEALSFFPTGSTVPTLYPFFGIGMYERALFQRLRGFDESITGDYWQFLDFGIRCWLYGYPVLHVPFLVATFPNRQSVIEDRSELEGYKRCHTKALCIRQVNGKNYARRWGGLTDARAYAEVKKRLPLYKTDFFQLVEQWKAPGES